MSMTQPFVRFHKLPPEVSEMAKSEGFKPNGYYHFIVARPYIGPNDNDHVMGRFLHAELYDEFADDKSNVLFLPFKDHVYYILKSSRLIPVTCTEEFMGNKARLKKERWKAEILPNFRKCIGVALRKTRDEIGDKNYLPGIIEIDAYPEVSKEHVPAAVPPPLEHAEPRPFRPLPKIESKHKSQPISEAPPFQPLPRFQTLVGPSALPQARVRKTSVGDFVIEEAKLNLKGRVEIRSDRAGHYSIMCKDRGIAQKVGCIEGMNATETSIIFTTENANIIRILQAKGATLIAAKSGVSYASHAGGRSA